MTLNIASKNRRSERSTVEITFVCDDDRSRGGLVRANPSAGVREAVRSGALTGAFKEVTTFFLSGGADARTLIVAGLGKRSALTPERLRIASARGAKAAQRFKPRSCGIIFSADIPARQAELSAVLEGAALSQYAYDRFISEAKRVYRIPTFIAHAVSPAQRGVLERAVAYARTVVHSTLLARDLGNAPGNELYPERLAAEATLVAEKHGFSVRVLDEHDIEQEGMGGVIAVGKGSKRPPRFVIMEYGKGFGKPVVLVGKGVTFDTGGISIKPSANMGEMKMDMCGAAAVIGTFDAVASLRLRVHLVGLIPMVENMPGGFAQRPGDIIRHLGGKTSEVDNTDAEGRLILADALAYADRYKPACVIDLATLTGAVVVALGHVTAGMMGTDRTTMKALSAAGEATQERVWELPLFEEYERLIRSDVADVKNVGGRWGGAITAGMFLKQHIGSYPWVHLDIAGTAILEENGEYTQRGASGFGVRLLTEYLRKRRGR